MAIINKYILNLYKSTEANGEYEIEKALKMCRRGGTLLDVGCWDGSNTLRWSKAMKSGITMGLEKVPAAVKKACKRGIKASIVDIDNRKWPIRSETIDCVVSNLVIEHMSNVDHFISETFRVLKKGGFTVVGTNNLSSWHNIFSLFLGWSPFDLANTSLKTWEIGNPFVLHKNQILDRGSTFTHKCVYTAKWLTEWYELYNFKLIKVSGSGYYPLPPKIGNIDKTHAALLTLVFKKCS